MDADRKKCEVVLQFEGQKEAAFRLIGQNASMEGTYMAFRGKNRSKGVFWQGAPYWPWNLNGKFRMDNDKITFETNRKFNSKQRSDIEKELKNLEYHWTTGSLWDLDRRHSALTRRFNRSQTAREFWGALRKSLPYAIISVASFLVSAVAIELVSKGLFATALISLVLFSGIFALAWKRSRKFDNDTAGIAGHLKRVGRELDDRLAGIRSGFRSYYKQLEPYSDVSYLYYSTNKLHEKPDLLKETLGEQRFEDTTFEYFGLVNSILSWESNAALLRSVLVELDEQVNKLLASPELLQAKYRKAPSSNIVMSLFVGQNGTAYPHYDCYTSPLESSEAADTELMKLVKNAGKMLERDGADFMRLKRQLEYVFQTPLPPEAISAPELG